MSDKQQAIDTVIEKIIILQKIKRGLADSKAGRVTPDKDLEKTKLGKWLN